MSPESSVVVEPRVASAAAIFSLARDLNAQQRQFVRCVSELLALWWYSAKRKNLREKSVNGSGLSTFCLYCVNRCRIVEQLSLEQSLPEQFSV